MYDIVLVLDNLTEQIDNTLNEMSKCKNLEEKEKLAGIVKTLCESLGIFFDNMGMMGPSYMDDMIDFEEEDLFSEDILDFNSLKKEKKKGKGKGKGRPKKKKSDDDIPF